MIITLAAVTSIDGKITQWDDPDVHTWASSEDGHHFTKLINDSDVVIMGRKTYDTVQPRARQGTLRIVMTRSPARFAAERQSEMLEFTDEPVHTILNRLRDAGHTKILVAGGAEIYTHFLKAGQVDRVLLTVEPLIFGAGRPLLEVSELSMPFMLASIERLNFKGTILLSYNRATYDEHSSTNDKAKKDN